CVDRRGMGLLAHVGDASESRVGRPVPRRNVQAGAPALPRPLACAWWLARFNCGDDWASRRQGRTRQETTRARFLAAAVGGGLPAAHLALAARTRIHVAVAAARQHADPLRLVRL